MKAATFLASLAAASGIVLGQDIQSKPFILVIHESSDKTLQGQTFSTCHSGAAIESICLYRGTNATFNHNTTEGVQSGPGGMPGILTWNLSSQPPIPSSMTFNVDPSTNVALPLFFPGSNNAEWVSFDNKEELNIATYLDDTQSPPSGQRSRVLKRWFVCDTYFTGYRYKTLSWVLGNGKPQNPSCVKVAVRRRFI
ncbi:hypothetical protein E4U21_006818 [Claviceps maximensis]|nr:hypothetical protein E4U21_006818 [Claviceps maximensis]